jgi:Tol biopolymer transport system component
LGLIGLRSAALVWIAGLLVLLSGCGSNSQGFNDTPSVISLFPSTATAGGPGFTLNIAGTGFISTSVVFWNNAARTTTFNTTSTQLSFAVTAQDIAAPGTAQVVVVNPSPGGGPSTAVNFTITQAQNPQPTISSLSPSGTPVGVLPAGNVLTVNGTNFISNSSVTFNGNARTTNFVSATQLTAPMTPSDVAANSTINVTVSNPAPGGGVSGSSAFKVGTGGSVRLKASAAAEMEFPQVVSVGTAGGPANGGSSAPAASADGRFVAFYSTATNLVAQGASGNIFVRDTCLGTPDCLQKAVAADLAHDGGAPNAGAEPEVAVSADGRFVAFVSSATNLLAGVSASKPSQLNIYVRDLCVGADAPEGCLPHTTLVSVGAKGDTAAGDSSSPSLSFDGRYIAFVSTARDLVPVMAPPGSGVYVRDTCVGVDSAINCVPHTYPVLANAGDKPTGQDQAQPDISADGRYVAFAAAASVTSPGAPPASQVLLADTCRGASDPAFCVPSVQQASASADRSLLAGLNRNPSISADARFVAFESEAADGASNVFLRDTCLGAEGCVPSTTLVVQNATAPSLSANGRYIGYIAASGSSGFLNVYDTCFDAPGACHPQFYPIAASSSSASLSSDGSFLTFVTGASIPGLLQSGFGDVLLTVSPF